MCIWPTFWWPTLWPTFWSTYIWDTLKGSRNVGHQLWPTFCWPAFGPVTNISMIFHVIWANWCAGQYFSGNILVANILGNILVNIWDTLKGRGQTSITSHFFCYKKKWVFKNHFKRHAELPHRFLNWDISTFWSNQVSTRSTRRELGGRSCRVAQASRGIWFIQGLVGWVPRECMAFCWYFKDSDPPKFNPFKWS